MNGLLLDKKGVPFLKKWLKGNDIEMYSTHNEGKCCC